MSYNRSLNDCVSVNEDDIKEYIARNYDPDDIFPRHILDTWAEENGYKKVENNE